MSVLNPSWQDPEDLFDERILDAAVHPDKYQYCRVIGDFLTWNRRNQGLTQRQLALLSGVGDIQIRLLEYGLLRRDEVLDEELADLAEALDSPVTHINPWLLLSPPATFRIQPGHARTPAITGRIPLNTPDIRVESTVSPWMNVGRDGEPPPNPAEIVTVTQEGPRGRILVAAGPSFGGAILRVSRTTPDGLRDESIDVKLDENGYAEFLLPEDSERTIRFALLQEGES